ncbi:MAG: tyrosine-type recombinase/integrase [Candidatus Aenigmarchaeota archaeon]|nr:tyrosine-type recombinase/integrase [Candidatus Aenigmarchaeota archaeon]
MDLNIDEYNRILEKYRTNKETAGKVSQIFSQGNSELSDSEYEAIVAGFMQNNAVAGMFEHVPANSLGLPVMPKDTKSLAVAILIKKGFDIVTKDKDIAGEVADFIARHPQTGEVIVFKCGPAMVRKVLSYLERPNTSLWILDHNSRLFTFRRGPNWDSFLAFHKGAENHVPKPAAGPEAVYEEAAEVTVQEDARNTEMPPEEEISPRTYDEPAPEKVPEVIVSDAEDEHGNEPESSDDVKAEEGTGEDEVVDDANDDSIRVESPVNPAFIVGNRKLPRILKEDEVAGMIRISRTLPRDNLLLQCMYFLGMSNAEIQNLKVEDIDFVSGKVNISQGKNRRDRKLPIPEELMQDLKSFIGARPDGFLIRGRDKKGKRISDRHIRRLVKAYAKEAGIKGYEEIHPHTLRHSYASHLLNQGTPIETVQGILGHERLETTAIYSQIRNTEKLREHVNSALGN